MDYRITITPIKESRISSVDLTDIPFGKIFTDHMFVADYIDGHWINCNIKPLSHIPIHPGNMAWHYGQSIFEGMKATRDSEGTPLLFRPEMHAKRINASAIRMCMPELPEELFVEAVSNLVALEKNWIPPQEGSALYIRPFMIAMDNHIGVRASLTYKFIILTMPVGPYYARPVKLKADEVYIRAAKGGVGEAKTAGNYAASLYPAMKAREEGYDQVMWLDAREHIYIQEVGTMNIFFVIDGKVITPPTDGTILKGITRDAILTILEDDGFKIEVRPITIHEVMENGKKGLLTEVFGSGTAAVVAMVDEIKYKDYVIHLNTSKFNVAPMLMDRINGIRTRKYEDVYHWLEEARMPEIVL
ncbi:MAG TPA: branched-chain amino acid aminotransferase [Saprospiraceae bacterium]|nr:branched-chain amino acid aminotransferase [Saprospiraceae bacterium]